MPILSQILLASCASAALSVHLIAQGPPRSTARNVVSASSVRLLTLEPHAAQWFVDKCTAIKHQCTEREEEVERTQAEEERQLEKQHRHEDHLLDEAQSAASEQREHVREQRTVVRASKKQVEEASSAYERTKSCPEEHHKLTQELEDLQAEPNESDEDIDAECQKKKEILIKEKCVDEHVKARDTVSRSEAEYSDQYEKYSSHQASAKAAEQHVEPIERRTAEAKEALDAERRSGAKTQLKRIEKSCRDDLEALERQSKEEVDKSFRRYALKRDLLRHGQHDYQEEKEDVKEQKKDTKADEERVKVARAYRDKHKDCPKELEQAEKELAELEAIPNESDEDIDAECMKKKEVLEKRRCVDKFVEAKGVLSRSEHAYGEERTELKKERQEKKVAKQTMKQQQEVMKQYEDAWKDAQAAQKALHQCTGTPLGKLAAGEEAPIRALKTTPEGSPKGSTARARLASLVAVLLATTLWI